jgi:hypothetical protein
MEIIFGSGSPMNSQALLSGSINTDRINRGNTRSNIFMSYATAISYRGLIIFLGDGFVTVLSNRTNDGFITV